MMVVSLLAFLACRPAPADPALVERLSADREAPSEYDLRSSHVVNRGEFAERYLSAVRSGDKNS